MKKKVLTITAGLATLPLVARAQAAPTESFFEQYKIEILLISVFIVLVLALLALIATLVAIKALMADNRPQEVVKPALVEAKRSFWQKLWTSMNATVPLSKEDEILTRHEYDGIKELDNRLPPWWVYGFYLTIIFSIAYLLHYHVFDTGKNQLEEYAYELEQADEQMKAYLAQQDKVIDETTVTLLEDVAELDAGKRLFMQYCSACHGQEGQGGVGPNFADDYWIHGGDVKDIFSVIKYGVPQKGMIAWQSQLDPKQIQQLSSFIVSLEGTNPPNQKEPQGEKYQRNNVSDSTQIIARKF